MAFAALHVVVGGGTGFLGGHIIKSLQAAGHRTTVISRTAAGPGRLSWDAVRQSGLPLDTDAVVNVSGLSLMDQVRWTPEFEAEVRSSRIGTNELLAAAVAAAPRVGVFVASSAVGIYPSDNFDATYDEDYDPAADVSAAPTLMRKLVIDWEAAAQLPAGAAARLAIVRWGVIVAPNGGVYKQMYWPARTGVAGPLGSGEQKFPWIDARDAGELVRFIIESPSVSGVLNGVAPEIVTNREFTNHLGASLRGGHTDTSSWTGWVGNTLRESLAPLSAVGVRTMLGDSRAPLLLEGSVIQPKRTQALGFRFQHPELYPALCEMAEAGANADEQ